MTKPPRAVEVSKFICANCRDTGFVLDTVREGVRPAIVDPAPVCAYESSCCFVVCPVCKGVQLGGRP